MRRRGFLLLVALAGLLVAMPLTATAASPNIGRISATSYSDGAGAERHSICGSDTVIETQVRYSGVGDLLGGTGTGELLFSVYKSGVEFWGGIEIDGQPALIEGWAEMYCIGGSHAILIGYFFAEGGEVHDRRTTTALADDESVCGNLIGSITDGVHPRQGSISLTLTSTNAGRSCLL